jgi:hypothetical protein
MKFLFKVPMLPQHGNHMGTKSSCVYLQVPMVPKVPIDSYKHKEICKLECTRAHTYMGIDRNHGNHGNLKIYSTSFGSYVGSYVG